MMIDRENPVHPILNLKIFAAIIMFSGVPRAAVYRLLSIVYIPQEVK